MNKKMFFMTVTFCILVIVGLVYGTIFSFILQGKDALMHVSIMQGCFVSLISAVYYSIFLVFYGICFDEEYLKKIHKIILNIIAFILLWSAITIFITNNQLIKPSYAWIYICNILFSAIIIFKSSYDGKVLNDILKKEKNKQK